MAEIPAICNDCDLAFLAPNLIGGSGATVKITGSTTKCPRCGGRARILDGVYELVRDVARLIDSEEIDRANLDRFNQFLQQAQSRGTTPEEVEEKAAELSPQLREEFRKIRRSMTLGTATSLLVSIISAQLQGTPVDPDNDVQVREIATRVVQESVEEHPPPVPPDVLDVAPSPPRSRQERRRLERERKKRVDDR